MPMCARFNHKRWTDRYASDSIGRSVKTFDNCGRLDSLAFSAVEPVATRHGAILTQALRVDKNIRSESRPVSSPSGVIGDPITRQTSRDS